MSEKIDPFRLIELMRELSQAIENDPQNALQAAQNLSADANIPVGWITRIEMGFDVMDNDGKITTDEAKAVIDAASKYTFLDPKVHDPIFDDSRSFIELMTVERDIIALNAEIIALEKWNKKADEILAKNDEILAQNEAIIESGSTEPLQDIQDLPDYSPKL